MEKLKSKVDPHAPLPGTEAKEMPHVRKTNATYLDERGRELPSPLPIAPPVGYRKTPSLAEQIRAMVRSEALAREAEAAGYETFQEAEDFDIEDDPQDPYTRYEAIFDPETGEPVEPPIDPRNAPPKAEPSPGTTSAGEPLEPTPPPSGGSAKR